MSTHPRLLGVATAVPEYRLERAAVMAGARQVFAGAAGEMERMMPVYANAGVESRHSCVGIDWYFQPHGWAERNRLYIEHALTLMEAAARRALEAASLDIADVDILVAVSSTGIATPSLDALLIERMGFRPDTIRLPIFGLGCAGGVLGLGRAAAMARAHPDQIVLLVVVELCGLTFRPNDQSKSNVIATALFGDGAAAVVIGHDARNPAITGWGEHRWPGSQDVMGWRVEDDGFGVLFSQSIPILVRDHFRPALDSFLDRHAVTWDQVDRFLCHPGGAKVVVALEQAIGLAAGSLSEERAVLRDYGNMSAATVLFVLDRAMSRGGLPGRTVVSGLGPGFTAGFLLIEGP